MCVCETVCLSACLRMCQRAGHAVVASCDGDPDWSPTRAGFHHDEVTLVLLVLNSLSNYIQSYARIIPAAGSYRIAPTSVYVCVYV